jgi:hypothetical protein
LFDRPDAISRNNGAQSKTEKSYGFGFRELDLFVSGKINEWISFEVDPKFSASSGATPKLGTTITPTTGTDYKFDAFGHGKAVIIFKLPMDVDMEVGQVHPRFTMEYGAELFWEDSFNGGKFAANTNLGAVHDNGIELSKSFDAGPVTLPVYLYILNGGTETGAYDINNQPGVMIHIEPVWNGLTVLGSILSEKTDVNEEKAWTKWSAGFMYQWENLNLRAEFVRGKQERYKSNTDLLSEGYYVKATYKVLPWLKLYAMQESAMDSQSLEGVNVPVRYLGTTPGFDIALADSTSLEFQCDIEDWRTSDGKSSLVYTRPFMGIRCTF